MIKIRIIFSAIIFSLVLSSCGSGGSSDSGSDATYTDGEVHEPFFADEKNLAMEAARSLGVGDTSLDGLWLVFLLNEQSDGPGKGVDDYRFVFRISEADDAVTFHSCAGYPYATVSTVTRI